MIIRKLITRQLLRRAAHHIGLVVLLGVGIGFFLTAFTITVRYEESAEEYFTGQHLADVTLYGSFDDQDVRRLSQMAGVTAAEGRIVADYRLGERVFRTTSLTDGINLPFVYEGRLPTEPTEGALLKRNAEAMGLAVGDTIGLEPNRITITGLVAAPEYVYLVQNERTSMAEPDRFGVVLVTADPAAGFNQIVLSTDGTVLADDYARAVSATQELTKTEQTNHILYKSDLDQIGSFALIFPLVFAGLIALVVFVMVSRIVHEDRRQIGTMKALGAPGSRISWGYMAQFCLVAVVGALIGGVIALVIGDSLIAAFTSMFEVPGLNFVIPPLAWLGAGLVALGLCAGSAMIALRPVLRLLPAQAMRPVAPQGSRHVLLERVGSLWRRASFNTRYAMKSAFRNGGRFLAVVLGMTGSCALMVFSLGFNDSITSTQDRYFDDFARYQVIATFEPLGWDQPHPVTTEFDEYRRVLMVSVDVRGENLVLNVVEPGFDMVVLPPAVLETGVVIPDYFAQQWQVAAGDPLEIDGRTVVVSAVVPQYLGLALYASHDYMSTVTPDLPLAYNAVFGRGADLDGLETLLEHTSFAYSTIDDDRASFTSIMETMSLLIVLLIGCSVVLGFAVLYSVAMINLSAREYEYLFMGVMGYPPGKILLAHVKEAVVQLVIAIPLGCVAGALLLDSIKNEFSNANFVVSAVIQPPTYVIAGLSVIAVTAVMALITSWHVRRLDIVEGLKARDD